MTITGYSDRVNHALAFAAKHHDRQVRKGTRLPYLTQPASVAIILTRYGQDDDTVVTAILHGVVADCIRENYTREMLAQRIADKFGPRVLETALAITPRPLDDGGVELSTEERRDDHLERLADTDDRARWVFSADLLHDVSTLVADLKRTIDASTVWGRFVAGRAGTMRFYRRAFERLKAIGFDAPIMRELEIAVRALEEHAGEEAVTAPTRGSS
jgi:(p)ppGpp synthase/HD superfamily hydrolase